MSNPKIVFTDDQWKQIENMAAIFCTGEEIANILGVDYDTLGSRIKERYLTTTSDFLKKHQSNGKMSLRRQQYKKAMEGNVTMMIWLGKQFLGQTDKNELSGAGGRDFQVQIIAPQKGILVNGPKSTTEPGAAIPVNAEESGLHT